MTKERAIYKISNHHYYGQCQIHLKQRSKGNEMQPNLYSREVYSFNPKTKRNPIFKLGIKANNSKNNKNFEMGKA